MWLICYDLFMWHFLISVNMLNNLNINSRSMRSSASSLSGLSLISPYDWHSGGRVPHIFRRDLVMRSFLRPFPMASSSRTVVTYWRMYGHLVLHTRLGSLHRNNVDRIIARLYMTLIVLTGPLILKTKKQNK